MIVALLLASSVPDPLISTLKAAHRDYQTQLVDKFADTTVDTSVVGKAFKIVVPLQNGDGHFGQPGPWYSYANGKLRLVFPTDNYHQSSDYKGPSYYMGVFGGTRTTTRSYTGSNAYGATARVQVDKLVENGIAFMSGPKGERPSEASWSSQLDTTDHYSTELQLPGSEARKVAHDAALVVEGTIAPLPDGKLSACEGMYAGPTFDLPRELFGETCWVGAHVSRVAFIRASSGEVIEEWRAND